MKTCLVVDKPNLRDRVQRQLDPSPRREHFYVTTPGSMIPGRRFDRIIITSDAARAADPAVFGERVADNTRAWFRQLEFRLLPGGEMVTL